MVALAERQRSTGALTIGAAFALTLVASLRTGSPDALPPVVVEPGPVVAAPAQPCPDAVRARLHLDAPTSVRCVAGNYGTPGYFVHATYDTTETWERYGVVALDGRVLVPMADRPLLRPLDFHAMDLNGDGVDEIVGADLQCGDVQLDVMKLRGDNLVVWSEHPTVMQHECASLALSFRRGALALVDAASHEVYRIRFAR